MNEEANVNVEVTETGVTQGAIQGVTNQMSQVNIAEEAESGPYTNMHKLILQGMIGAQILNKDGVEALFELAYGVTNSTFPPPEITTPLYMQRIVREINAKIVPLDMSIRSVTCEITGEKFYMLLVNIGNPMMKFQTFFTKFELAFFHKLMHHIISKSPKFSMSMIEALNIRGDEINSKRFSKNEMEHFIERMIAMQYLTRLPSNDDEQYDITLGCKTIREFEPMFTEKYGDCFTNCCVCKSILLNGLVCPKCPAVIHRGCANTYLKQSRICVSCNVGWSRKKLLVRIRNGGERPSASLKALASTQPPTPETVGVLETSKKFNLFSSLKMPISF